MFSIDAHMTLKKSLFLGLVVLLAGSGLLGWLLWQKQAGLDQVIPWHTRIIRTSDPSQAGQWAQISLNNQEKYNQMFEELQANVLQAKSEQDLTSEQEKRLQADLEMLASCPPNDPSLAQALYGKGWEAEVNNFRRQKSRREFLLSTSLVLADIGGFVCLLCLLVGLVRLVARRKCAVSQHDSGTNEPDVGGSDAPVRTVPSSIPASIIKPTGCRPKLSAKPDHTQNPEETPIELPGIRMPRNRDGHDAPTYKRDQPVFNEYCLSDLAGTDIRLRNLFTDEPLSQPVTSGPRWQTTVPERPSTQEAPVQANASESPSDANATLTQSLQSETAKVEQQIDAFKELAQGAQAPAEARSEPMNQALQEMSTQISAIREYAASQQDRVEKLQNGYDWNIIRQFGLRIIRCVDNLEQRIDRQGPEAPGAEQLTEIRDELLFALESSGIEQFMPEPHSPYRGQERTAEAVKEKEPCARSESAGRIANVVKPGYQYVIDEENVKVVRTARVKLYG